MNNEAEVWQVQTGDQIHEVDFDQLKTWIVDGSILRIDRVRKGELRWIEAGKVPALIEFFNARDSAPQPPPVITTASGGYRPQTGSVNVSMRAAQPAGNVCSVHPDAPATFLCETCTNVFCKTCPNSYGGTVRICPFCGAMCSPIAVAEAKRTQAATHTVAMSEGFGFGDFANSFTYPFKFKASLFIGAIMFAFFSVGQSAAGFGGIFMMGGALLSFALANMLTFGVLANTVENFSQGKIGGNFMPSFDDFSIWDDVMHPFFLSIGAYISSFGPFIAVLLVAVFMIVGTVTSELNGMQDDAARTIRPDLPHTVNSVKQGDTLKGLVNGVQERQLQRVDALDDDDPATAAERGRQMQAEEDAEFARLDQMIKDSRKQQLESVIGKAPETVAQEKKAFISTLLGYGVLFLFLGGITLLWGIFYFPAACAVAGYTRSFVATINPAVGLDTIRRLGGSYFKILLMAIILFFCSAFVSGVIETALVAFDMPGVGNVPAKAISSLFAFYFSVVFSCVLGFAIYKAADRLQLTT